MPVLRNARFERFAQEISKGLSQTKAAKEAGYSVSRSAAQGSIIAKRPEIIARVAELNARVERHIEAAVSVSKSWVIQELARLAKVAEGANQLSVARSCIRDIGEHLQMFVNKTDHTFHWDGDPSTLTDDQLEKLTFHMETLAFGADRARLEAAKRQAQIEEGRPVEIIETKAVEEW